jgi:hypothetical protein
VYRKPGEGDFQVEEGEDGEVQWSGCVFNPTVRRVHREYWPKGMFLVETNHSLEEHFERIELAPRFFYVSGFEGREGASISNSVRSAKKVKDILVDDYEALEMDQLILVTIGALLHG